jgi:hypothetical protein
VDYGAFLAEARAWARLGELSEYGSVLENGREYPLLRLTVPGKRWLLVTAGFHGEEPAGPLTLLRHMSDIVDHARKHDVGLRVYPCINPSGFEAGTRYNASGERPNNDLIRYEVSPGVFHGELHGDETFLRWVPFEKGPKETRALSADLRRFPAPQAALDIHQDGYMKGRYTYAYVFGELTAYRPLMAQVEARVAIARQALVDEAVRVWSDAEGFVVYRDGSVTDYCSRIGVPYTATLETTCETPLGLCHEVNLAWLKGFIELAGRG